MAIFGKSDKTPEERGLPENLPKHVGIIMDGNGRWAKKRGLPRKFGHREGAKTCKKIIRYCREIGIQNVSLYAFSTENWNRPDDEVHALMDIFLSYIEDVRKSLPENTRFIFLGDKEAFNPELRENMIKLEEETKDRTGMNLMLALNYGGRDEITRAARRLAQQVADGTLKPEDITEQSISDNLYTAGFPDVDLVIRPSGELRLSNYLIWQCAYAEYYFTDVLWPDFSPADLDKALIDFESRQRRFGGV
jgi:undecaprenyl diphosphate synthase